MLGVGFPKDNLILSDKIVTSGGNVRVRLLSALALTVSPTPLALMQRQRQDAELPTIPLELHDNIIGFLWDDQRALGACSLVARAWLPAARSHKFHTLCLQSCYRRSSFEELLDSALLTSRNLTRYVRELRIGVDPQDNAVCEPKLQRAVWHDLGLIRLLRELTALEVLHLENLWWDPSLLSQEMAELLLAYARKVTSSIYTDVACS